MGERDKSQADQHESPKAAARRSTRTHDPHEKKHLDRLMDGLTVDAGTGMPHEEYAEAASDGEQQGREAASHATSEVLRLGRTSDRERAAAMRAKIDGYKDRLLTGIRDDEIRPSAMAINQDAVDTLASFDVSAGEQRRTLADFQASYRQVIVDSARFNAQLTLLQKESPGLGGNLVQEWGGEKALRDQAMTVSESGGGAAHWGSMQASVAGLDSSVGESTAAESEVISKQQSVAACLAGIEAGLPAREKAEVEGSEILATTTKIKGFMGKAIDIGFKAFHIEGAEIAKLGADLLVDLHFEAELTVLEAKTKAAAAKTKNNSLQEQVWKLRAALSDWAVAQVRLVNAKRAVAIQKNAVRDSSRQFSGVADARGEFAIATIAELFAEARTLSQQIRMAIGAGVAEGTAAGFASTDLGQINLNTKNPLGSAFGVRPGLPYVEPVRAYTGGKLTYTAMERTVLIDSDGRANGRATDPAAPVVSAAVQELKDLDKVVSSAANRLGSVLGFTPIPEVT
jgi:hypothetical protein